MSNNPEFDRLSGAVLDMTTPGGEARVKTLLRLIFRAGSEARLDHELTKLGSDPLTRLSWLLRQDMLSEDVKALVREAEDRREQDQAFTRTYGLTESDLHSMVGEGFHTAFRKAVDHPYATAIHKLIKDLPPDDWNAILDFVTEPVISWLREAQERTETETA